MAPGGLNEALGGRMSQVGSWLFCVCSSETPSLGRTQLCLVSAAQASSLLIADASAQLNWCRLLKLTNIVCALLCMNDLQPTSKIGFASSTGVALLAEPSTGRNSVAPS
jgi:hypothetical protein